ncbi:hypothetical protein Tco_1497004, partial [Tanacetum coccineum]
GPEASGALFKKSKMPKSKKPPTETKATPPKPTEGSEQSHSVGSQYFTQYKLERVRERDGWRICKTHYTLDEGTRKSKPLPESTATHPKDLGGNIQPLDNDLTSTTSEEGSAKTTPRPEGSLRDKDSGGKIPPANMEPINTHVADPSGIDAKYQDELDKESDEEEVLVVGEDMDEDIHVAEEVRTPSPKQDQPEPSNVQDSASDSSSPDLKKFDNTLPLTERQLIKYLRKMSRVLFHRITEDNWKKHEEVAVNYANLKALLMTTMRKTWLTEVRLTN